MSRISRSTDLIETLANLREPKVKSISARQQRRLRCHCGLDTCLFLMVKIKWYYFKTLWTSEKIDEDDKKAIWEWFDTFIFLSEKYIKVSQTN